MRLSPAQAATMRQLEVLLVENNTSMRAILVSLLKATGIQNIREAKDGGQALLMMADRPVNLVLTDLEMSPMNGMELTRKIRAGENGIDPRLPVIALTGHTTSKIVQAALKSGVNGLLAKPVDPRQLVSRIDKVIHTRVIYRLNGNHYVGKPSGAKPGAKDLLYEGVLPLPFESAGKTVEKPGASVQEDDAWVLD